MIQTPVAAVMAAATFLIAAAAGPQDSIQAGQPFSATTSRFRLAAHAGDLDPRFGSGGRVVTDFGSDYDYANAVALQPDGRIVVAGETDVSNLALARYMPNG